MNAWVCFKCPAHGMGDTMDRVDHGFAHPGHHVAVVWAQGSPRWAMIHRAHPHKAGKCADEEHIAALDAKEARQ